MRGKIANKATILGDKFYDYAKLYQSLIGYDFILNDKSISFSYIDTYMGAASYTDTYMDAASYTDTYMDAASCTDTYMDAASYTDTYMDAASYNDT